MVEKPVMKMKMPGGSARHFLLNGTAMLAQIILIVVVQSGIWHLPAQALPLLPVLVSDPW